MDKLNSKQEKSTGVKLSVSRGAILAGYEVIKIVYYTVSTIYEDEPQESDKFIIDNCKVFLNEVEPVLGLAKAGI